jgi:hypothetical protein
MNSHSQHFAKHRISSVGLSEACETFHDILPEEDLEQQMFEFENAEADPYINEYHAAVDASLTDQLFDGPNPSANRDILKKKQISFA